MDLMRPGRGYSRYVPFVGTTVFHWFLPNEGNVMGPWQPLGGRKSWDGEPDFWVGQIKQIMMANIDAVYMHCIDKYEQPRINFFKACNMLRRQGWEIPKVAPFLDPHILWAGKPPDVATKAGKDEYTSHYIRFFQQYLTENTDNLAATGLLHIDGKPVLTSWWVWSLLQNLESLTREDIQRRLIAAHGTRIPSLHHGIYMMSDGAINPDYSFTDERIFMFAGYTYALHCVHQGMNVWHVQPGYWDQNIRQPGYLLPRNGGSNYRNAWEIVPANLPHVHRVYVESWNEYDEGSGIYAAEPVPPYVRQDFNSNTDVFSDSNDPFEYINTTARGAARINGRPENDAVILGIEAPYSASSGSEVQARIVVRNEGNVRWTGAAGYGLRVGSDLVMPIDDQADEIPLYGGIFRGRPVTFNVKLPMGAQRGTFNAEVSMAKDGVPFGEKAPLRIELR